MTMINAAPTATAAPSGASPAAAVPVAQPAPAPVPAPLARPVPNPAQNREAKARQSSAAEIHLLGSVAPEDAATLGIKASAVTVPLDQFAKQSGPDASVQTAAGVVSVHAVFQFDAKTRKVSVAIVNADGQLVRMIPPESVSAMITAMSAYRGR